MDIAIRTKDIEDDLKALLVVKVRKMLGYDIDKDLILLQINPSQIIANVEVKF